MHHYNWRCEPFLVKIATFSWPPFVTWLWEGGWLIADISALESFTTESCKNKFHEKGGQFLHTNGVYCVLLAINSSNQRKIISVSHVTDGVF